jgi:RND family efflux transporter MFP subunit
MATSHLFDYPLIAFVLVISSSQVIYADTTKIIDIGQTSCLLEPSIDIQLSSPVQGVVREITVKRGDRVKKNQVVMKLNSKVLQASLETVSARLEFAKREVQRSADLYKQNLISEHEQDEMLTEKNLAEFQVKEAQLRLSERETLSPISGIVVERYKKPGEYVDETPIMRVVSLNPLHAEVVIQADMYGEITKKSTVSLYTDNSTSRHDGIIKNIDPIIDAASNTFAVTIELNNSKGVLIAGSRCRVEFKNK